MTPTTLRNYYLFILLALTFGVATTPGFAQNSNLLSNAETGDVTMTIDNKTTSENFEEITEMLKPYGVTVNFSNVKRNAEGELTGLGIELKNDLGQTTRSTISSNLPIGQISFGVREGQLFIDQDAGGFSAFSFQNSFRHNGPGIVGDSIFADAMQQMKFFNFDELFGEEGDGFNFSKDSMAIDKFRNNFYGFFKDPNAMSDVFSWMNDPYAESKQTYQFIDDPNKERLIIIDGKPSDFSTLDGLAKSKQIDQVDVLKPDTARSIYGEKAKDGAIIVTTKK